MSRTRKSQILKKYHVTRNWPLGTSVVVVISCVFPSYTSGHGPIKGPIVIKLREVFVWDLGKENSEMPRIRLITCEWCEIRLMTMQELILQNRVFWGGGYCFFKHCLTKGMLLVPPPSINWGNYVGGWMVLPPSWRGWSWYDHTSILVLAVAGDPLDYQVGATAGELLKWPPQQCRPDQEIQLPSDIIEEASNHKCVRMVSWGSRGSWTKSCRYIVDTMPVDCELAWKYWCRESNAFPFCF